MASGELLAAKIFDRHYVTTPGVLRTVVETHSYFRDVATRLLWRVD